MSTTEATMAAIERFNDAFNKEEPERGRVRGLDVFRVGNGRVAEKFSYVKSAEVVRKLGLQLEGS